VHKRDDQGIVSEIARMSGTDPKLLEDPELLAFVLPAIRSDYTAAETYAYQPGAALACPVVALNGADDQFVSRAEVDNWRAHTDGTFEMREFPGDHFYLNTAWPQIAHLLTGRLSGVAGQLGGVGATRNPPQSNPHPVPAAATGNRR
jgi:surfactin synthase thioesterase subunit